MIAVSAGFRAVPSVQLHWAPGAWGRQNDGFFHLKLTICPQTYPIQKEIVISAVLVINSLCGDHFLIA